MKPLFTLCSLIPTGLVGLNDKKKKKRKEKGAREDSNAPQSFSPAHSTRRA
jgi:hypothetical protein